MNNHLLVLEDDSDVCRQIVKYLSKGFLVDSASTLEDAREKLKDSAKYSVLVADMRLHDAGEGGLELARELARLMVRPQVIIMTAFANVENANLCMQAGVFSYVEKGTRSFYKKLTEYCEQARRRWQSRYIPELKPEAIIVVDLIDATATASTYGWHGVGRKMLSSLRKCITTSVSRYGLDCHKSTGDGYLLAFREYQDTQDAGRAMAHAFNAMLALVRAVDGLEVMRHERMRLRFALHFGEVDVIENDREGLEVSFAFRLEALAKTLLETSGTEGHFAVLSEKAVRMLAKQGVSSSWQSGPAQSVRGFDGEHKAYLLLDLSKLAQLAL